MLSIGNKTFMNLQEAVGWLLENNALPFQSTANYVGNTEIAMSTLINPSPAKVRVGSIIFFADSKVSTVVGVTSNSFIVSDQYNDLVDDVVYVSNVAINASGHLIVTLSNGTDIDAGLIKQVTGFSINASQHLIVTYNDGSTTDLGAIFSGNITISGNLTVTGGISGNAITGNSIIENMSGYSYTYPSTEPGVERNVTYVGVVKNGNKLTMVDAQEITRIDTISGGILSMGTIGIPTEIGEKLYSAKGSWLAFINVYCASDYNAGITLNALAIKDNVNSVRFAIYSANNLVLNTKYYIRIELTFLLSENLAS